MRGVRNARPEILDTPNGTSGPRVSDAMTMYAAGCRQILKGRHGWLASLLRSQGICHRTSCDFHPNGWVTMSS